MVPVEATKQQSLAVSLPFIAGMQMLEGRATAYVCRDFACRLPVNTPDALASQLSENPPRAN